VFLQIIIDVRILELTVSRQTVSDRQCQCTLHHSAGFILRKPAHIGMLRRQQVFDWGGGGGRRIFYLHIGDRIMVCPAYLIDEIDNR
jgi:hypothetical protein